MNRLLDTLRYVREGYDRRSFFALGTLGVVYLTVAIVFNHLIDLDAPADYLLGGIWLFMTATLVWGVDYRRDLKLAFVAFFGGLVIEWWGTTTHLWWYYTKERPPLWILPAWPVAALTIERMALVVNRALPARASLLWWVLLPGFVVWMTFFGWKTHDILSSRVIFLLMVGVLATATDRRKDLAIFLAGGLLGIFLEYWGTSRFCWRYYTREVPPAVATVAHGFASVAFWRGKWAAETLWARIRSRAPDQGATEPARG